MAWAAIGQAAASAASSFASGAASSFKQYKYQKRLNQQAYDLTQRGYREQYGNMRQGLENAGYNPLLAVNGGMSGATFSGGSASAPNMDFAGSMNAFTNAKQQRSQNEVNDATVKQLESQVGVNNAEANYKEGLLQSEIIKQSGYDLDNAIKDLQRQKEQKELDIWDKKLLSELENIQQDTTLKRAHAYQAQMDAISSRIQAGASVTNAKANYMNATEGNPYRLGREIGKKVFKWNSDWIPNKYGREGHW
ncbi:MAG: DNA pilot protein [Chaetfec virus UA24_2340]|nr:MAG: DNA pilot protein [Chaetfec virus UA24_2340]